MKVLFKVKAHTQIGMWAASEGRERGVFKILEFEFL